MAIACWDMVWVWMGLTVGAVPIPSYSNFTQREKNLAFWPNLFSFCVLTFCVRCSLFSFFYALFSPWNGSQVSHEISFVEARILKSLIRFEGWKRIYGKEEENLFWVTLFSLVEFSHAGHANFSSTSFFRACSILCNGILLTIFYSKTLFSSNFLHSCHRLIINGSLILLHFYDLPANYSILIFSSRLPYYY